MCCCCCLRIISYFLTSFVRYIIHLRWCRPLFTSRQIKQIDIEASVIIVKQPHKKKEAHNHTFYSHLPINQFISKIHIRCVCVWVSAARSVASTSAIWLRSFVRSLIQIQFKYIIISSGLTAWCTIICFG